MYKWYILNSSPPCAAYIRQWTRRALAQAMACRRFGAKPLPEPMLIYCQLDGTLVSTLQWELNQNTKLFIHKKCFWKCLPRNGGHFVQGEMISGKPSDKCFNRLTSLLDYPSRKSICDNSVFSHFHYCPCVGFFSLITNMASIVEVIKKVRNELFVLFKKTRFLITNLCFRKAVLIPLECRL